MRAALLFLFVLSMCGRVPSAHAQILVTPNIEEICRAAPVATNRRTVVYIDIASINARKTEWGLTLLNRLELGPREPLTILAVNPSSFEVSVVFDSCFPTLTKSEIDEARSGRSTWDKMLRMDPVDQQRENLQTFDARLRNALDRVIAESSKFVPNKRRNILGAIAFDKNRFSERTALYRVIVCTDGVLADADLDGSGDVDRQVSFLSSKYPANFSGADVYVFGALDAGDKGLPLEVKEKVFAAFFLSNWAYLKSFSSSLPQQRGELFPPAKSWDGSFDGGGAQGAAKLVYSQSHGGSLSHAWVAFAVGRSLVYVPFEGDLHCEGEQCTLAATSSESVPLNSSSPYFRKGDRLLLKGKPEGSLEGILSSSVREVFKDGNNQEVKYNLKFPRL
ncbi:hypothetical protein JQ557_27940 [Bradyrhizobium sp. U87765 SZCCT0131]|uniref:hypothetical protein n=1 Tax=unclassified Bradyrhizobium TaxID=2631580 RepID=UPI001BABF7C5|nr:MULTISPECIES: hypothetical protein [unclassified Bradyrhizobium]MBR1221863.1 hypothetical protein [Bradyrhizobium sp. U87765 SZCCT0131]MBR1263939.1 hypothetical protein [Bradyrhizobium sp. U87765 SZCCT0134]MBR1302491.1 hypothetical protein [Bradyrhizobium sp. U87765 SZCCT0110]MBR1320189.1 hypothetical protein [Bradyrhizobium sp. U87765 SZCCT0109]MBR1348698.1 hypothetical protein [Bradyrhizobium sp. U87765 SZCCT0048]